MDFQVVCVLIRLMKSRQDHLPHARRHLCSDSNHWMKSRGADDSIAAIADGILEDPHVRNPCSHFYGQFSCSNYCWYPVSKFQIVTLFASCFADFPVPVGYALSFLAAWQVAKYDP